MKYIIATLLFFLAASLNAADSDRNYTRLGMGTSSCASYVKDFNKKYESLRYTAWANGFITSYNVLTDGIDNIANGVDVTAREEWLYNYCKKNTLDNFDKAVQKLVKELIDRKQYK